MRAVAPEWVLENLKELNDDITIGFKEEDQIYNENTSE
jgi:hypothetical protein